jgi:hypothetical protein
MAAALHTGATPFGLRRPQAVRAIEPLDAACTHHLTPTTYHLAPAAELRRWDAQRRRGGCGVCRSGKIAPGEAPALAAAGGGVAGKDNDCGGLCVKVMANS